MEQLIPEANVPIETDLQERSTAAYQLASGY